MTEWKTIDSARTEDAPFLAIQMTHGDWFKRQEVLDRRHFHAFPDCGGVWIASNGMMPTHWMPLPSPPKET